MFSDWKGPLSVDADGRNKYRRRFIKALIQRLYRRSGFNALPMIALGFVTIILLGSLLLTLPLSSVGSTVSILSFRWI